MTRYIMMHYDSRRFSHAGRDTWRRSSHRISSIHHRPDTRWRPDPVPARVFPVRSFPGRPTREDDRTVWKWRWLTNNNNNNNNIQTIVRMTTWPGKIMKLMNMIMRWRRQWRRRWRRRWMNEWTDTSLRYSTATEECVSNDFFRHSLGIRPASYLK